jgi:MHS family proline/betaine transporter-like MFS transporter
MAALKYAPRQLLKILGLTCMSSTLYYVFFGYFSIYLEKYIGIKSNISLVLQSFFLILMLFLVPLAGICGDYFGRKKMLMWTALFAILFALPCFYLLQSHSIIYLVLIYFIATLLSSSDQGNSLSAVVENCPADIRYSGVSISYNIGMAVFGGIAPLVLVFLTQKLGVIAPAYYLMIMAGITFIAASSLLEKASTKDVSNPVFFHRKNIKNTIYV